MKRRLISLLLALCMVFAMQPDTAQAATKITKVVITMSELQPGKALPTDAKVPDTASTVVKSVKWKGDTNNGKAKEGVKYTATITVEIKSGVKDKTFASAASSINATVNGKKASVKRNSATSITVTYTFPALSGKESAAEVIDLGVTHIKEDLNARWAALKPVNTDENLYSKKPEAVWAPYVAGKVRTQVLEDGVNTLNFARYVAGLNADVSLVDELNEKAQYGAVLLGAVNKLVHEAKRPNDMDVDFYKKGYEATTSSNLFSEATIYASTKGTLETFLSHSVIGWLSDSGVSSLGHRIWVLNPVMKGTGFGVASGSNTTYSTMWVTNTSKYGTGTGTSSYDAITWPAAGYHPTNLFFDGDQWSVRLNGSRYSAKASNIQVKVTNPSGETQVCKAKVSTTSKDPLIIFTPSGKVKSGNKFDVEISGITRGDESVVLKYSVEFFKLDTKGTSDLDLLYLDKLPAEKALKSLKSCASNYTKAEDVIKCIKAEVKYADTVEWVKKPTITKATASKAGSLKGTVKCSRNDQSFTLSVNLTLAKQSDKTDNLYAAAAALKRMEVSNGTTKAQVEAAAKAAVTDGVISVKSFKVNKKATKTETGQIYVSLKGSTNTTFGVYMTIPALGGTIDPEPTAVPTPAPTQGASKDKFNYDAALGLGVENAKEAAITNSTTEGELAAYLQELLPKEQKDKYTYIVEFTSKTNATVNKDGQLQAKIAVRDLTYNYTSSGTLVYLTIPATGSSDSEEVAKIEADMALIQAAFDARVASAKSENDLKKADLLKIAEEAVKNGSKVRWLNTPLFSTRPAKDGEDGHVKGTLRLTLGAETREIEFSVILHADGTITNAN
ncbi:MAG: CAP domain-containing protein [Lachnospiraceae bacterium]|nr:CAP domain-containing protein [Lachnospiraceae bacterium]